MSHARLVVALFAASIVAAPGMLRADEPKVDVQETIKKGLDWLAKSQHRTEGHWEAQGGQYPTTMTALAGMCFLMEGSTLKEGKYSDQVTKAVGWFTNAARQQPNGMIGDVRNPTESTRYMYGQGFGTLFLASVY